MKETEHTPTIGTSWKTLKQWGNDVTRIERLAGGVANDVWSVRVSGQLAVARLGARGDADLAWEVELLQYLDCEGLTVPLPIPTADGRLFAEGLIVMTYVDGGPPKSEVDWRRVADTLRHLHRLTQGCKATPKELMIWSKCLISAQTIEDVFKGKSAK